MDETSMSLSREGRINFVDEIMLELLRIDCQETARRIETDLGYRWMVHQIYRRWIKRTAVTLEVMAYDKENVLGHHGDNGGP